jgi:fructose-bisphosphate aldolase class II
LHGGSGTPFDQMQRCPSFGVAKINVGAAVFEAGKAALLHTLCHDSSLELVDALIAMEQASEDAIIPYLQASGAIGKA